MLCPAYVIKINKLGSYMTDYSANKIPLFCGSQKASEDNEVTPFCVANAANDLPLYVALRQPLVPHQFLFIHAFVCSFIHFFVCSFIYFYSFIFLFV